MTAHSAPAALPHRAYAGLVSRLAALGIDVILLALGAAATRLLPPAIWQEIFGRPAPEWFDTACGFAAAALPWLYFTGSWWLASQTVGGLIIGIVVLRPDGGELSLLHAALRAAILLLLAPVWMVGMLAVLWDEQRRAWHDRLLRTVVRYAPRTRHASAT
jgi:uncharacterized RDD family membrane protein YckC